MNTDTKTALFEAAKEPLRLLVLSVLPILITYFAVLPYQWALFATLILKMVDSFMHEYNKLQPVKKQNEGLLGEKGLTNF